MINVIADSRGFVADLPTDGIKHIAINVIKPGCIKGNHYHKLKNEYFYLASGQVVFILENTETNAIGKYTLSSPMAFVEIPKNHAHKVENIGDSDAVLIQMADQLYNDSDSYKYLITEVC